MKLNRNGQMEDAFGTGGVKTATFNKSNEPISDIEVTPDGFVAGSTVGSFPKEDFFMRRYTKNGQADVSFGFVLTDTGDSDYLDDVTVLDDGKVLAVGATDNGDETRILLARYNNNGDPSASFGNAGIVITEFPGALAGKYAEGVGVVLQNDGRAVVAGSGDDDTRGYFLVARYKN